MSTGVSCSDDPAINPSPAPASFDTLTGTGVGRYNDRAGATVEFTFTDAGEPGRNDVAALRIKDSLGRVVLDVRGKLHEGNHQAHDNCGCPAGHERECRIACNASLQLQLGRFQRSGTQSIAQPAFYLGRNRIDLNAAGQTPVVPLLSSGGNWIADPVDANLSQNGWPKGAFVVVRRGDGAVTLGQYGYYPKGGSWSYYQVATTVLAGVLRSVQNTSDDPFEHPEGPAVVGNAGRDRLGRDGNLVSSESTVTGRADLFKLQVSCDGDDDHERRGDDD